MVRAFTFGHVRQLDRVLGELLARAWEAGAGPGAQRLVIEVDSFIQEVHGKKKHGASYGYTSKLGYHPLLATRAGSSEVLHMRFRTGKANSQRGIIRFTDELIAPRPPRRRLRGDPAACRLRLSQRQAQRTARREGRAVLDQRATDRANPGRDRPDRRGRVD
jgi:hypothetical protein